MATANVVTGTMDNVARKKIVQEYYSKRAKDYDRQKIRTWSSLKGFGDEIVNELLDVFAGFKNELVLEVGVGSGRNALPLMEKINPQLVGLDLSREMLGLAKAKMSAFKQNFDLILGDAENPPFVDDAFDALICMSAMHYFSSQEEILKKFSKALKEEGIFVYGDLTIHELDNKGFFETLERILSKAHARYHKPSEMQKLMRTSGFRISKMKTITYRKSYSSLIEDKGEYFDITPEMLQVHIRRASEDEKDQYGLTATKLALYYTMIVATRT